MALIPNYASATAPPFTAWLRVVHLVTDLVAKRPSPSPLLLDSTQDVVSAQAPHALSTCSLRRGLDKLDPHTTPLRIALLERSLIEADCREQASSTGWCCHVAIAQPHHLPRVTDSIDAVTVHQGYAVGPRSRRDRAHPIPPGHLMLFVPPWSALCGEPPTHIAGPRPLVSTFSKRP